MSLHQSERGGSDEYKYAQTTYGELNEGMNIGRLHGMEEGGSGEDDYWQAVCGRALLLETVITVKRRNRP